MAPIRTSKLTHKQLAKLHPGFTRNELNYHILNVFHLHSSMIAALEHYSFKRMSGAQFSGDLVDGIVTTPYGEFQVIYQACNPYAVKRAKELKLSFRKPNSEWNIPETVLIRISCDMDGVRYSF